VSQARSNLVRWRAGLVGIKKEKRGQISTLDNDS